MKMNPVVHFELPYIDRSRMAEFYAKSFGWKYNMLGEDMGNYVVVMTSEEDEDHRPKERGMINGGLYEKPKEGEMGQHPSVVISVDNIEESIKMVEKAGGKVVGKPDNIPGVGLYVSFIDTEGNRISMLQPLMES